MEEDIKNKEWAEWINTRHFKYEQVFKGEITMQEYIDFIENFYKIQTNRINTNITDSDTIT